MNRSDRAGFAVYGVLTVAVLAAATVSAVVFSAAAMPASAVPVPATPAVGLSVVRTGPAVVTAVAPGPSAPARRAGPGWPVPAGSPAGRPASARPWRLIVSGHYGSPVNASGYPAVVAPARDDAWVFGGTNPGESSRPAAEHWNGHGWQGVTLPSGLASFISWASASGPANVWAVSAFGGYVLHWNGMHWLVARKWAPAAVATGITAVTPADVWLFGAPGPGTSGTGTWKFNGRTWTRITGPGAGLTRASAVRRHDIWGVTAAPTGGSVLRWNGHSWRQVRTGPALRGARLDDVLATSAQSVWVVGTSPVTSADGRIVVAHWNGKTWRRSVAWGLAIPRSLAADGHGGIWITAMTLGSQTESRLLRLSASGRWTQTIITRGLGNSISDLALIPGTTSLWGSGGFLTPTGGDAAIWLHGPAQPPHHHR